MNAEYREQSLEGNSTNQPTDLAVCTGLRFNCNAGTPAYRQAVIANSRGEVNVSELGGEILVPIFADAPAIGTLNASGAARHTDYSTSGSVSTWKVGLDWHPIEDLSFRATTSRDIRAPTVYDLFGPQQLVPSGYNDLLTGRNDVTTLVSGGNPGLVPEEADTYTIGVVYKPEWLSGFSASLDFFDIQIAQAITAIDGRSVTYQQQCINSNFTSPVCALYVRPISPSDPSPANYPTRVYAANANVADVHTQGVDVDLIYKTQAFGGDWDFRLLGTYQPKFTAILSPTDPVLDNAGVDGLPEYRLTGMVGFTYGPFFAGTQTTWHSATKHSANPTLVYAYGDTAAKAFTDLTLTYDLTEGDLDSQLFLTVNNLFDTAPAPFPAAIAGVPGFGTIATNGDDVVGRYYTLGVRAKF